MVRSLRLPACLSFSRLQNSPRLATRVCKAAGSWPSRAVSSPLQSHDRTAGRPALERAYGVFSKSCVLPWLGKKGKGDGAAVTSSKRGGDTAVVLAAGALGAYFATMLLS